MGGLIADAWRRGVIGRDRRPIYVWAEENVICNPPLTRTGPFRVDGSRHFIAPFDALQSDETREVNVRGPVRGGKTLILDVFTLWRIANRPGPHLWLFQENSAAADQAEQRVWPSIRSCRAVERLLSTDRHKNRGQEIIFPHMPFHIRGCADSVMQSRGYELVTPDEPWMWEQGKLEQARGRLGDFVKLGTDKFVCVSQGGPDAEDWARQERSGLQHEWEIQCAHCNHFMPALWTGTRPDGSKWGMRWEEHKDENGFWLPARACTTVRFECERCGHPHVDFGRTTREWNRTGRYQVEVNPNKSPTKKKSFHWTAVIDFPWSELLEMFLHAMNERKRGNLVPLITFTQKRLAEHSSERSVLESGSSLTRSSYEIMEGWAEEDVRFLMVDKQADDVYWTQVRSVSRRAQGESRRLSFKKVFSYEDVEAQRIEFHVEPNKVLIDSGYRPKGDRGVYAACVKYDWTAVKGVDGSVEFWHPSVDENNKPIRVQKSYALLAYGDPEAGTEFEGRTMAPLIRFSSDAMADRLDGMIAAGLYKEPLGDPNDPLEKEYDRQMHAEYKKTKTNKFSGEQTSVRVCPSGNNHAYDLGKIFTLGAILCEAISDPMDERGKTEPLEAAA